MDPELLVSCDLRNDTWTAVIHGVAKGIGGMIVRPCWETVLAFGRLRWLRARMGCHVPSGCVATHSLPFVVIHFSCHFSKRFYAEKKK